MHDKNGTELRPGDIVTLEMKVVETSSGTEYCNVRLETVEPFYPDANRHDSAWFNTKQCVLKARAPEPVDMPKPTEVQAQPMDVAHEGGVS